MSLQHMSSLQLHLFPLRKLCISDGPLLCCLSPVRMKPSHRCISSLRKEFSCFSPNPIQKHHFHESNSCRRKIEASKNREETICDDGEEGSAGSHKYTDVFDMDDEEREEWRSKIRDVIRNYPEVDEVVDADEKKKRMQQLLADYPLVVEEEDPNWPEDADGRGFNLDQFFDKITIKKAKKEDDEDDDSENQIVWQDDDYIRPIKDITSAEWEDTVFKDISPLVILVHNRYKRPKENEEFRDELEKAVHIIWNCRLPSPRCVAIDAVVEHDLVSALQVSIYPELIFTKSGKVLYRETAIRTAEELSKIMAFFYFGAAKPPCLSDIVDRNEGIPSLK